MARHSHTATKTIDAARQLQSFFIAAPTYWTNEPQLSGATTMRKMRRPGVAGFLAGMLAILLSLTISTPAQALSGSGYNNTLPYPTGCGQGAYVITSKAILGGTVSMVYSPKCQTNWIEWYGPTRFTSKKMMQPAVTTKEDDTASWSYSRQVYAPGTTVARAEIWVWGNAQGTWAQGWSVRCGSTCSWTQFY